MSGTEIAVVERSIDESTEVDHGVTFSLLAALPGMTILKCEPNHITVRGSVKGNPVLINFTSQNMPVFYDLMCKVADEEISILQKRSYPDEFLLVNTLRAYVTERIDFRYEPTDSMNLRWLAITLGDLIRAIHGEASVREHRIKEILDKVAKKKHVKVKWPVD